MFKKILSSQLRVNMASGMATTVVNIAVMVAGYPIYLYFLGYEKYGVWLVLATVLTFVQLGNLGIGPAVMKLVAEEYGRGDIEAVQRYITAALALLCISGTFALIVILTFKSQIIMLFKLNDENSKTVSWLLPYVGILSIYVFIVQVFDSTLSGLGRMDLTNYIQSAGRIAAVIVAAVLLYSGRGIESLLIASIASYLLIHIADILCICRIAPVRFLKTRSIDTQCGKRLLHFGGGVFGGAVISMLFSPFNKLMLSRYAGVSAIPVYEIAFTGSTQVRALIESSLKALMPEISRIGANMTACAKDRIVSIYHRAMKFVFLLGVPLYAGLIIAASLFFRLWLGERFVESLPNAFRIMLVGAFVSLLGVPAYYMLLGLGMVRHILTAHIIVSCMSALIVLTTVFIWNNTSVEAVAWAGLAATVITTLYLIWQNTLKVLRVKIKL